MIIKPAGDRALTVEYANVIREEVNRKVCALNRKIHEAGLPGITETVPSYRALLVLYDPAAVAFAELKQRLERFSEQAESGTEAEGKTFRIPVCYGGTYGEDLKDVAAHAGLSEEEVIRIHAGATYRIYMLGFLPGFPYLGGMDARLATPRLMTPRTRIPAGSVGIGGSQTGIYPLASPGGWRLIGQTPLKLYDPERTPDILYRAGDSLEFYPVTPEEFRKIQIRDVQLSHDRFRQCGL